MSSIDDLDNLLESLNTRNSTRDSHTGRDSTIQDIERTVDVSGKSEPSTASTSPRPSMDPIAAMLFAPPPFAPPAAPPPAPPPSEEHSIGVNGPPPPPPPRVTNHDEVAITLTIGSSKPPPPPPRADAQISVTVPTTLTVATLVKAVEEPPSPSGKFSMQARSPAPTSSATVNVQVNMSSPSPPPSYSNPSPPSSYPTPSPAYTSPRPPVSSYNNASASASSNVHKVKQGTCQECRSDITGDMILFGQQSFHPEHFICNKCRRPLGNNPFFEVGNTRECKPCHAVLQPDCAQCGKKIEGTVTTAVGKKYHPEHFVCVKCHTHLAGSFFEKNGQPYCERDYDNEFTERCVACGKNMVGEITKVNDKKYHPACFTCCVCQTSLGKSYYEKDGKPYCDQHYHGQFSTQCNGCGQAIASGKMMSALGKKFHPQCFQCAQCRNVISGSFHDQNGRAYCVPCGNKMP